MHACRRRCGGEVLTRTAHADGRGRLRIAFSALTIRRSLKNLALAQPSENFVGCSLDTLLAGKLTQLADLPARRRSCGSGEYVVQRLTGRIVGEHGLRGKQRAAFPLGGPSTAQTREPFNATLVHARQARVGFQDRLRTIVPIRPAKQAYGIRLFHDLPSVLVGFADNSGSRLPNVRRKAMMRHTHYRCFGERVGYRICVASCQRYSVIGMADCKTTFPGVPRTSVVNDTLTSPEFGDFPGLGPHAESSAVALARIVLEYR